jgi:integrase
MPRRTRSPKLETRTARLKLPVAKKPLFQPVNKGIALGYRRNQGAGTWVVRATAAVGAYWTKAFAVADDIEDANGKTILTYDQACDEARRLARQGDDGADTGDRPMTVGEAITAYEHDLAARGAQVAKNATRARNMLPPALLAKPVALLTINEVVGWRDARLATGLQRSTITRDCRCISAALNLAARRDQRILNHNAWRIGLAALPDSHRPRNQVLADDAIRAIVAECYRTDPAFGLFIEVLAVTGCRASQAVRLQVGDLRDDRLIMPRSKKGRGQKRVDRRPIPVPAALMAKLRIAAGNRAPDERLLLQRSGEPWRGGEGRFGPAERFGKAVKAAGLPHATPYALRHSSITRAILAGVPARVIAEAHDTSIPMLERNYSHLIADHSDAIMRGAMLDLGGEQPAKVVALRR